MRSKSRSSRSKPKKSTRRRRSRHRRFCDCVRKVRSKSLERLRKSKPKKPVTKKSLQNPYGICTASLYNNQGRRRRGPVDCSPYGYEDWTKTQLEAKAISKGVAEAVTSKLTRGQLADLLSAMDDGLKSNPKKSK